MGKTILDRGLDLALGFGLGLLVAAGIWAYHAVRPSLPSVALAPDKALADAPKETVPCTQLQANPAKFKKNRGLPPAVVTNPSAHLTGSGHIPGDDRPRTLSIITDTATGETVPYLRRDPLPWLAFDRRWTIGAFYGVRDDVTEPVGRLTGSVALLQIKAVHLGVHGQLDTDGRRFGGLGAWASGR